MRNTIAWAELDSAMYERMVAVLISRIYPTAHRIDGSGGDGGRDVQILLPEGRHIYELKSFTGRITTSRRKQVKQSLTRAGTHDPVAWSLVVPIDPTPAEETWFSELTSDLPFACSWLGLTWLDQQFASRTDISRYYLEGTNDEIVSALRELGREEAALAGGVPDALDRLQVLTRRLNDIDPHYSFALSSEPDGRTGVSVYPKYVGALDDRPLRVETKFAFPTTPEGRAAQAALQAGLDYGIATVIVSEHVKGVLLDLPAGLGGFFESGEFRLGAAESNEQEMARVRELAISVSVSKDGRVISEVPLRGLRRTGGMRGVEVSFQDASESLTFVMRLDKDSHKFESSFAFSPAAGALPSALLPASRYVSALQEGAEVIVFLEAADGVRQASRPTILTENFDEGLDGYVRFLAALEKVQRTSGITFAVPYLSEEELKELRTAERLLDGETVVAKWDTLSLEMTSEGLRQFEELTASGGGPLVNESDLSLTLAGRELHLGRSRQEFTSVRLHEARPTPGSEDGSVTVVLVPDSDDSMVSIRCSRVFGGAARLSGRLVGLSCWWW